jgi:urease accessory protein
VPTVALINTAGGLTGGDELVQTVQWHSRTHACITTPAAEKIYRSSGGRALIVTRLRIADNAHAEWLPQETILFDGGRIERNLEIELEGTATIVACDGMVFGRLARNEILGPGYVSDTLKVWRDGRLILFDRTRVDGPIHAWLDGNSTGRGNRATGMVLVSCATPEALLVEIRGALADNACLSGASLVRGLIHVRLLARNDIELRTALADIVALALDGRPVPRNWSC